MSSLITRPRESRWPLSTWAPPTFVLFSLLWGCPSGGQPSDGDPAPGPRPEVSAPIDDGYSRCELEDKVGALEVDLGLTYPTIYGSVANGVVPFTIMDIVQELGECTLLMPPDLFCDPPCAAGETCGVDGDCVTSPTNQEQGTVEVIGLSGDVVMEPIPPTQVYNFNGNIPYPPFAPGDPIELYANRVGAGFSMIAHGVERLELLQDAVNLASGQTSSLSWTPPSSVVDSRVAVSVNIANHGGIPARIECYAEDDGTLDIDSSLVTGLLDVGFSGFPSVTMTRHSSDTTQLPEGCVQFVVQSEVVLPALIPGLISCSDDDDCPQGQSCLPDLTCG